MKGSKILLFLFCLLLGLSLIVLARMSNGQRLYVSPKVLDDYRVTIAGEEQVIGNIEQQIEEARAQLAEYEAKAGDQEALIKQMEGELQQEIQLYRLESGAVPAIGPGVEVVIDDGDRILEPWENPNDILVHDSDILLIINDLKESGAEMISVNGQRLVDESAIACSGYTIRINGQFFARPFVIRAIGDGSRMAAALIGPGGYGTVLREWGLVFKVTVADDIYIPKFTEGYHYKYMKAVTAAKIKEGE